MYYQASSVCFNLYCFLHSLWMCVRCFGHTCQSLASVLYHAGTVSTTLAKTGNVRCKTKIPRKGVYEGRTREWAATCRRSGWKDEGADQYFWNGSEYWSISGKVNYLEYWQVVFLGKTLLCRLLFVWLTFHLKCLEMNYYFKPASQG